MRVLLMWILRGLLLASYVLIQYYVYKKITSFIGGLEIQEKNKRRITTAVKAVLLAINLPAILYASRLRALDLPKFLTVPALEIFTVWLPGSLFAALILGLLDFFNFVKNMFVRKFKLAPPRWYRAHSPGRRKFLQTATSFVATAPIAAFTYGAITTRYDFKTEPIEIPIKDLPTGLCGLCICQLTDIHMESFPDPDSLEEVVRITNDLNPDLIFLTGDYLTSQANLADEFVRIFSQLNARHGIYGSLGNHEIYTRTEATFTRKFGRKGIEILSDEIRDVKICGEPVRLAGIDYVRRKIRKSALKTVYDSTTSKRSTVILLSHQPNIFPEAAKAGVDATFSGHTHGGQIKIDMGGFKLSPSDIITPYVSGHYRVGSSNLYVSRGIGTVGIPLRINAPAEITVAKLVRA